MRRSSRDVHVAYPSGPEPPRRLHLHSTEDGDVTFPRRILATLVAEYPFR
jgi:hypothetical protein